MEIRSGHIGPDLKMEEDLWANFRYILEQNNKERLDGEPLTDTEFEQVKNQLRFHPSIKRENGLLERTVRFRYMCREIRRDYIS